MNLLKRILLLTVFILTACSVHAGALLKIGLLPIEDSVPFYVAEQEKMYAAENLQVELIPFQSALERDSALAAGAIDGAIDDPIGAILFDKGQGRLKITSICLGEKSDEGVFAILAAPDSGLKTVGDLKGVEIAVSNSTIIEYVTDRILAQQGFKTEEIKKLEVIKMPIRMQMLLSNAVKAATLPEPLASIAVSKGARVLISDATGEESLSQTIIVFRAEVLKNQRPEIAAFFRAYKGAVQAINNDPEKFRALFVDKGRIPPFLAKTYPIPFFPLPTPFSPALFEPVMNWLAAKQLVAKMPYTAMVATDFMDERN
ncbi:MAG: ABC transporter substrate-binding protein [Proteobacteria bacterium]|nr:ABC transporter substrate-binding protein [Pseudomonadota bacterium]